MNINKDLEISKRNRDIEIWFGVMLFIQIKVERNGP